MLGEDDEYDYHCYSCGAGHYNEVGWGPINCSRCGGPVNEPRTETNCSDEQYAETMLEFALSMGSSESLIEDENINKKVIRQLIDKKINMLIKLRKII